MFDDLFEQFTVSTLSNHRIIKRLFNIANPICKIGTKYSNHTSNKLSIPHLIFQLIAFSDVITRFRRLRFSNLCISTHLSFWSLYFIREKNYMNTNDYITYQVECNDIFRNNVNIIAIYDIMRSKLKDIYL